MCRLYSPYSQLQRRNSDARTILLFFDLQLKWHTKKKHWKEKNLKMLPSFNGICVGEFKIYVIQYTNTSILKSNISSNKWAGARSGVCVCGMDVRKKQNPLRFLAFLFLPPQSQFNCETALYLLPTFVLCTHVCIHTVNNRLLEFPFSEAKANNFHF